MLVLRWNTRVVPTIGVRAACARRIFSANQDVRVIRLTCCYRVLSKCCLKLGELVDLRGIASERIKETPAVLEARTQSEGGEPDWSARLIAGISPIISTLESPCQQ